MRAEKSLGQHFLRDVRVLEDIAAITDVAHSGGCLEIGPGEGALTAFLVSTAGGRPIVAIDPDPRAIAAVTTRFGGVVKAVLGDATRDDLGALLPGPGAVVVGNLPYNAASLIHRRVLALGTRVARAVLMFQKEVALRLVARPSTREYGIPSILTQVVATAYVVREVGPECFSPRPKVDSAVVLIEPRPEPLVAFEDLERFGDFLGLAFQQRRKTLSNSMGERRYLLEVVGIASTRRAEELSIEEWVALFRAFEASAPTP